ncbi:hypothetical protein [Sphingobium chlorophenolicum]|uniref:hypothetical protein n=1 Tax=Sphingobium chlorophenolicum TaxID=46429 RepID=UPI000311D4FA|nr:hypothetical protein [Sphingobium chlorophenolicum]
MEIRAGPTPMPTCEEGGLRDSPGRVLAAKKGKRAASKSDAARFLFWHWLSLKSGDLKISRRN